MLTIYILIHDYNGVLNKDGEGFMVGDKEVEVVVDNKLVEEIQKLKGKSTIAAEQIIRTIKKILINDQIDEPLSQDPFADTMQIRVTTNADKRQKIKDSLSALGWNNPKSSIVRKMMQAVAKQEGITIDIPKHSRTRRIRNYLSSKYDKILAKTQTLKGLISSMANRGVTRTSTKSSAAHAKSTSSLDIQFHGDL